MSMTYGGDTSSCVKNGMNIIRYIHAKVETSISS